MTVQELINSHYSKLSENDKIICKYIIANKDTCYKLSISEFAHACNVSNTTLFRFTKKITLPGFSELKAMLKFESENMEINNQDFLSNVIGSYHKTIEDMKKKNCTSLFEKMSSANRIIVYGSTYSKARAASELKRIFLPAKKVIFSIHGSDMLESIKTIVKEGDLVVIISLSGESKNLINLVKDLKLRNIFSLSITKMMNNTLAQISDENLYMNSIVLPKEYNINYEISTTYFILIEILFLKYQNYLSEK